MVRRSREYTRVRKRIFVVAGITLSVVTLVAFLLSWLLSTLVGPANLYRYRISSDSSRSPVLGSGLNLAELPAANFLRDSSFEPFTFRHSFRLLGGSDKTLYAASDAASDDQFGDGFFEGASIRVLAADSEGLSSLYKGTVAGFGLGRVGIFQLLSLPVDVPPESAVLAFARNGSESLAVGRGGLVLRNVVNQPIIAGHSGIRADLTGVCPFDTGFLVVSAAGDAAYSTDGLAWVPWFVTSETMLKAVAADNAGTAVAVGNDGIILVGSQGVFSQVPSVTDKNLNSIAYGDGHFIAAGDGVLLQSADGLTWKNIFEGKSAAESELSRQSIQWQSVSYQENRFIAVGSKGSVVIGNPGNFEFQTATADLTFIDAVALSDQQFILLDQNGNYTVSNDGGLNWRLSTIETGMTSHLVERIDSDRILGADAAGHLGQANIVAEIELASPLTGEQLQPGDVCFLEMYSNSIPADYTGPGAAAAKANMPWQIQGGEAVRSSQAVVSAGGQAALRLQSPGFGSGGSYPDCFISQILDNSLLLARPRTQIYRLELFMRQEKIDSRTVTAWISGPFTPVTTRFENVGSTYKKYIYTFVLPFETRRDSAEIRLNIGFNGPGTLWLDRVYLGPAVDQNHGLDRSYAEAVKAAEPRFIRLAYTGLGGSQTAADEFALPVANSKPTINNQGFKDGGVRSLDAGLQLCLDTTADPYLVLGSYLDQTSLHNLLEYLCGPVSEPYGQLRMLNDRIIPYTDNFNRIILEFSDEEGLFSSDLQRSSYVNLMIRTIEQSAYYRELKSKLIYVDGMNYESGVLLSRADYHASDFELDLSELSNPTLTKAFLAAAFNNYFDRIPRTPERTDERYSEVMRQTDIKTGTESNGQPRLADLCEILLQDLGRYTTLSFLNYPAAGGAETRTLYSSAAGIVSRLAQGVPLEINLLAEQINEDEEREEKSGFTDAASRAAAHAAADITIYAFSDGSRVSVCIINAGEEPVILELSTELPLLPASIEKYNDAGQLLSKQPLRRLNSRINLLPGSVALISSSD